MPSPRVTAASSQNTCGMFEFWRRTEPPNGSTR